MVWVCRMPMILRTSAISSPAGNLVSFSTPSSSPSCVQIAKSAVARLMLFQRLRLSQHFAKIEYVPLQAPDRTSASRDHRIAALVACLQGLLRAVQHTEHHTEVLAIELA
jgi:hypothetical protein